MSEHLEACTSEWFVDQEPSSIFSPLHMSSLFDNLFTEEQWGTRNNGIFIFHI